MEEKQKGSEIVRVEFETNLQPIAIYKKGKDYVFWGEKNNYPNYLLELYKRDSYNGAIIKGKADYVFGKGLTYNQDMLSVSQQAVIQKFIKDANPNEDWNELLAKMCLHFEIFEGYALQIVWKVGGMSFDVYVMQIAKLRRSPCGKKIFYCEKWVNEDGTINSSPQRHESFVEMDLFNPNVRTGKQVFFFKLETPSAGEYGHLYPEPNYLQCIQDIETNIEITNHCYNTARNGMSAGSIVTFFNGEPEKREKRKIADMFKATHAGSNNAGKAILNFADKGGTPASVTPLTPSDMYQQFDAMAKRVQQTIFTGHNANPILFGIQTDNGISNPTDEQILIEWDKFLRAYVEGRQKIHLDNIKYLGSLIGVDLTGLEIESKTPISVELPLDNPNITGLFSQAALKEYVSKKYGIKEVEEETEVEMGEVNEHLKNLTGRHWQNIQRIQRNYRKGKINKAQAEMLLKSGYGLTQGDIETLLSSEQFSAQNLEDEILREFEMSAEYGNDDEIIKEEMIGHNFATIAELTIEQITQAVLEVIKGNPSASVEEIAKTLKITESKVTEIVNLLKEEGYIEIIGKLKSPTQKAIDLPAPKLPKVETYTVYKYVLRDNAPDLKPGGESRKFCQRLMKLSDNGATWSRGQIDRMNNKFGLDVFDFRGGFYTNPNSGRTTAFCRHAWKAITKVRKK